MKTVILCGGYGTRIRDVANDVPKPMISIGSFPILWHIMKYYSCWGHNQFVLCLGYKGHAIKDFFLNYEAYTEDFTITLCVNKPIVYHNQSAGCNWEVTLAETGLNTMTGGRIKKIQKYLAGEKNFMLTYGDGLGNIDLEQLVQFHHSHNRILTVTGVRPPGRFGELRNDATGLVTEFNEKPQTSGGLISGGFFVCRQELFDYLGDDENLVFEEKLIQQLVRDNQMMVYEHEGFWQPMDTYRDYSLLTKLYDKGEAPWIIWR